MIKMIMLGLVKFLLMTTPFFSMLLMLLALWGVVGKATYTDLETARQSAGLVGGEAKNYLVNDTKGIEQCPTRENAASDADEEDNPMPKKIDWEHVI